MEKKIIFKKYIDPFKIKMEDLPDATDIDDEDENEYSQWEKDKYHDHDEDQHFHKFSKGIKILSSPAGLLPLNEESYPSSQFNLWTAHTNFPITEKVFHKLNREINGIEIIRVLTKYRFLVGIALAFREVEVKADIIKSLCASDELEIARMLAQECKTLNEILPEDINEKVQDYLENNNKKYFMLYVTPNGHFNTFSTSTADDQLYIKLEDFHITQRLVGGAIFTNFD